MKEFLLINPIVSSIESIFSGSNSLEAAKNTYKELSNHFGGKVKKFKFSLLKMNKNDKSKLYERNNNDFYHFTVSEKDNNGEIEFLIQPIDNNIVMLDEFKKRAYKKLKKNKKQKRKEKKEQKGGKSKYRELEDDSSDSSDYYIKKKKFDDIYVSNWWYNPLIYLSDSIYIPTLISPFHYYTLDFKPVNALIRNNGINITHIIN